jgi:5-formyltetrahydrofolate cyclo-ligase
MEDSDIVQAKQAIRERVWDAMEREGVALPPGPHGRIPRFMGAEQAAERLAELPQWKAARVIMANPDWAQLAVRVRALEDGKLVYMAVPRLASIKPFYKLDPAVLQPPYDEVATPEGAAQLTPKVGVDEMQLVDLVVAGSVAVNRAGVRIGKGAGYADRELAILTKAALVGPSTHTVTTIHSVQILHENLPESSLDFRVRMIITPEDVVECD